MRYTIVLRPGQGDDLLLEVQDHDAHQQRVYGIHFPSKGGMVRLELGEDVEAAAAGDAQLNTVVGESGMLQGE